LKRKESVEVKNKAEALTFEIEKQLKEWEEKVPADQLSPIKDKLTSLKSAIESGDSDKMKSQTEELEKLFAAAYQAAAAAGATAGGPDGMPDMSGMGGAPEGAPETKSQDKGKVVDADFEVVDKDK
jgi:molecular chaperone DnaK